MRTPWSALVIPLLAGCTVATGPADGGVGTPLAIEYASLRSEKAPRGGTFPPTATGGEGRIEILGLVHLGTPCHTLDAELRRVGSSLRVTILITAQDRPCIQILDTFAYRTAIDGLSPGEYNLSIDYEGPNGAERGRVLTTTVTVR